MEDVDCNALSSLLPWSLCCIILSLQALAPPPIPQRTAQRGLRAGRDIQEYCDVELLSLTWWLEESLCIWSLQPEEPASNHPERRCPSERASYAMQKQWCSWLLRAHAAPSTWSIIVCCDLSSSKLSCLFKVGVCFLPFLLADFTNIEPSPPKHEIFNHCHVDALYPDCLRGDHKSIKRSNDSDRSHTSCLSDYLFPQSMTTNQATCSEIINSSRHIRSRPHLVAISSRFWQLRRVLPYVWRTQHLQADRGLREDTDKADWLVQAVTDIS